MKSSLVFACRGVLSGFAHKTQGAQVSMKTPVVGNNTRKLSGSGSAYNASSAASKLTSPRESFSGPSGALPKLPVPPLNDTLSKYLKSVRPLLSNEEYEKTLKIVKEFGTGDGQKLQSLLEDRAANMDNWLSEWWLNSAYLEYRWPVVVYSSPGLIFPLEKFTCPEDQYRYAAKMIYGALRFKQDIDTNSLPPDTMGNTPLDMSQYKKIFGTNRNPLPNHDELSYNPNSQHIVIVYKNYFYKVNVYKENGEILSPLQILEQIESVADQTQGLMGVPFGLLTTEHRDSWAKSSRLLSKDVTNKASMKVIQEALFLLAIDRHNRPLSFPKPGLDPVEGVEVENAELSEKQTVAAMQMIHGNKTNSGNRWFDKTIQFVVGAEGEVGLTYEHSPAEGPPISTMMDYIVANLPKYESLFQAKEEKKGKSPIQGSAIPEQLPFNLKDKKIAKAVADAKDHLYGLIEDLDMACFSFVKYGKEFIKSCKLSPDSFIQMSIQAAFYKIHGSPGSHYESASTRMFVNGRTETIRSCSSESLEFAKALNDPALSPQEKYKAMKRAIDSHKNYASDAVKGRGVDRHLLGLKTIAMKNGLDVPSLFMDAGYVQSTHFRLSTSQVPSNYQAFMCYGPLTPNGYGVCYNPTKNEINFGISAFNASPETHAANFKIALQQTLVDMQNVAIQATPSKL